MNFSDLQRSRKIRVAYDEPAATLSNANAPRQRFRAMPLIFALTLLCALSAQAQTQPPAQKPPQAQAPAPAQTVDESTGKTSGNYTVQQSIEFGYRDSLIG